MVSYVCKYRERHSPKFFQKGIFTMELNILSVEKFYIRQSFWERDFHFGIKYADIHDVQSQYLRYTHKHTNTLTYGTLQRFHSPKKLEPLEAGEQGGIMVSMFFEVRLCCVVCCVGRDEMLLIFCGDVVTHHWWLTWIWKKLRTKGLVWFMRLVVFFSRNHLYLRRKWY